jgi:hypothetical protein
MCAEASFSQGDRWKRLISRYIAAMPPMLEPGVHNAIGDALLAAMQAMTAKVGDAARDSQPAAPRACPGFAVVDVVIFQFPIDCRGPDVG